MLFRNTTLDLISAIIPPCIPTKHRNYIDGEGTDRLIGGIYLHAAYHAVLLFFFPHG